MEHSSFSFAIALILGMTVALIEDTTQIPICYKKLMVSPVSLLDENIEDLSSHPNNMIAHMIMLKLQELISQVSFSTHMRSLQPYLK